MEFRAATQEDLDYVRENPYEGAVKNTLYSEVPDSNTYAVVYEGSLVAVGGVQVFLCGGPEFHQYKYPNVSKVQVSAEPSLVVISTAKTCPAVKNSALGGVAFGTGEIIK